MATGHTSARLVHRHRGRRVLARTPVRTPDRPHQLGGAAPGTRPRAPVSIDMLGRAPISFAHFVLPGPGRPRPVSARCCGALLLAAWLASGCNTRSASRPAEDTETGWRISAAAAPDTRACVGQE